MFDCPEKETTVPNFKFVSKLTEFSSCQVCKKKCGRSLINIYKVATVWNTSKDIWMLPWDIPQVMHSP